MEAAGSGIISEKIESGESVRCGMPLTNYYPSGNGVVFARSRKAKILTTGIHWSISRIKI
jgi:hypothetical protein